MFYLDRIDRAVPYGDWSIFVYRNSYARGILAICQNHRKCSLCDYMVSEDLIGRYKSI